MRIKFTLPGKPVAQGRPRFYRKGKFVVATDPKPSKVYKADIAYIGQKAREEAGARTRSHGMQLRGCGHRCGGPSLSATGAGP